MTELMPCAFCQSGHLVYSSRALTVDRIEYCQCGATAKADHWNNRPREQEVERYKSALEEIREIYAGMDSFVTQTAAEGYLRSVIERIWIETSEALANE